MAAPRPTLDGNALIEQLDPSIIEGVGGMVDALGNSMVPQEGEPTEGEAQQQQPAVEGGDVPVSEEQKGTSRISASLAMAGQELDQGLNKMAARDQSLSLDTVFRLLRRSPARCVDDFSSL